LSFPAEKFHSLWPRSFWIPGRKRSPLG
jgi:hypothetical protein